LPGASGFFSITLFSTDRHIRVYLSDHKLKSSSAVLIGIKLTEL